MSNIPFNTIASILQTGNVQREVSAPQDKAYHDQVKARKTAAAKARQHTEMVEDSTEYGVDEVHDQGNQAAQEDNDQMPRRRQEEKVEIEGIDPNAKRAPKLGDNTAQSHLDISA